MTSTPPPYYSTFHLPPQVRVPCPEGPPYPCNTPPIEGRPPSTPTAGPYTATSAPISVPLAPQTFNTELGSQYGLQYEFHYSQCVGRKKALLIGINYFALPIRLSGCINDVRNISSFINQRFGFAWDDMVILTDDTPNSTAYPTRQTILRAMKWLVKDARANDSLFFHYSGHGGQSVAFLDNVNGYEDTIFPGDFQQAGHIKGDEMHEIMVRSLPAGCRLTALFDCCHSGSALDLPYEYGYNGLLKEPNLLHEAAEGILGAGISYFKGDLKGLLTAGTTIYKKLTTTTEKISQFKSTRTSPADVIQFSGCKDYQVADDAIEQGMPTGALSWAFREILTRQPRQSYHSLLVNLREVLKEKHRQKPVLSASHPIDIRLEFII